MKLNNCNGASFNKSKNVNDKYTSKEIHQNICMYMYAYMCVYVTTAKIPWDQKLHRNIHFELPSSKFSQLIIEHDKHHHIANITCLKIYYSTCSSSNSKCKLTHKVCSCHFKFSNFHFDQLIIFLRSTNHHAHKFQSKSVTVQSSAL